VMFELFGDEAEELLGGTARLIGMQYRDEVAGILKVGSTSKDDFAALLVQLLKAQGEDIAQDGLEIRQKGWHLMRGLAAPGAGVRALNALWEGLAAAHDRNIVLSFECGTDEFIWRIS